MGNTKIKICGLTRREDIEAVNKYRPDYIGFVFCKKSRRYITPARAAELRKLLDPGIIPVGVFLDNTDEEILEAVSSGAVDMIQLHGLTGEEDVARLRELTGKKIIRAFNVRSKEDVAKAFESSADRILLDSESAGSGMSFDWEMIGDRSRDFFLAGGLNAENLEAAIRTVKPWGVDLSGGAETDGAKDADKIRQVAEIVRNCDV